jgi:myosin heavy subunit
MMFAGMEPEQLAQRRLKEITKYRLLSTSGCIVVEGVDDSKEWHEMCAALNSLGMSEQERGQIFDVTAAVLHMANVTFEAMQTTSRPPSPLSTNPAKVKDVNPVKEAARLLQVDCQSFIDALTGFEVRGVRTALSVSRATDSQVALVTSIYAQLFDWIVHRINRASNAVVP